MACLGAEEIPIQCHCAVPPELSPSGKRVHSEERPRCLPCGRAGLHSALSGGSLALVSSSLGSFSSPPVLVVDRGASEPVSLATSLPGGYRALLVPRGTCTSWGGGLYPRGSLYGVGLSFPVAGGREASRVLVYAGYLHPGSLIRAKQGC